MKEVTVSARTLAIIGRELDSGMRRLRVAYRADPDVYRDLVTIYGLAGCEFATQVALISGVPETSITTKQAAQITGLTNAAITKAIRSRRLRATKHGTRGRLAQSLWPNGE